MPSSQLTLCNIESHIHSYTASIIHIPNGCERKVLINSLISQLLSRYFFICLIELNIPYTNLGIKMYSAQHQTDMSSLMHVNSKDAI